MPLEGHWDRVNTPLRRLTRRERNVAIVAVAVSIAAILVIVLVASGNSAPKPAAGCIYAIIPGVMGAEPVDACGEQAKSVCARRATDTRPGSAAIRESCRRAGISLAPNAAREQVPTGPPQRSIATGL